MTKKIDTNMTDKQGLDGNKGQTQVWVQAGGRRRKQEYGLYESAPFTRCRAEKHIWQGLASLCINPSVQCSAVQCSAIKGSRV